MLLALNLQTVYKADSQLVWLTHSNSRFVIIKTLLKWIQQISPFFDDDKHNNHLGGA